MDPQDILNKHGKWLRGENDGERANLARANLAGAYLADANLADANLADANLARAYLARAYLADANLNGVRGNMREVKSAQFDKWAITWIRAPDGETTLQIGCQRHPLAVWGKSDPHWIAALDTGATEWWAQYRNIVLALVKASPAVPYGVPQ